MYGLIMLLKSSNFIEEISPGDICSSKELNGYHRAGLLR
jgi:hypothetical protein